MLARLEYGALESRRTLVLRLVVEGEGLRSTLDTENSSGVTSVTLAS
jgi:hypothetical protein